MKAGEKNTKAGMCKRKNCVLPMSKMHAYQANKCDFCIYNKNCVWSER